MQWESKPLEGYHVDKIDAGREEEKQNGTRTVRFIGELARCIIRNQKGFYLQTSSSFGRSLEHMTTT